MTTFKQFLTEQQQLIDNVNGLGAVPINQDVDHFGMRVKMTPSTFLDLAEDFTPNQEKIDYMVNHLEQDGSIGASYLQIMLPSSWTAEIFPRQEDNQLEIPQVHDHDGRNRMIAVKRVYGDIPVETHLFFNSGIRNRHIKPEWVHSMNDQMRTQDGDVRSGPFFKSTE